MDVFISYEDLTETNVSLKYNEAVAAQYVRYHKQMAETFGIPFDLTVSGLGRCPEVFTMEEEAVDEDEIWTVWRRPCGRPAFPSQKPDSGKGAT